MHEFDWQVTKSDYVLQDRWITVRADTCTTPAGHIIEPYYVLEYPVWVNVVALTADDQVILVRQYRHGLGTTILGLPSGTVEPSDPSPLEAGKRELCEETGYLSDDVIETGTLSANPATHTNLTHCYLATNVQLIGQPVHDETERVEVVPVSLQTAFDYAVKGELPQSLHVSSLFLALAALGRLSLMLK